MTGRRLEEYDRHAQRAPPVRRCRAAPPRPRRSPRVRARRRSERSEAGRRGSRWSEQALPEMAGPQRDGPWEGILLKRIIGSRALSASCVSAFERPAAPPFSSCASSSRRFRSRGRLAFRALPAAVTRHPAAAAAPQSRARETPPTEAATNVLPSAPHAAFARAALYDASPFEHLLASRVSSRCPARSKRARAGPPYFACESKVLGLNLQRLRRMRGLCLRAPCAKA